MDVPAQNSKPPAVRARAKFWQRSFGRGPLDPARKKAWLGPAATWAPTRHLEGSSLRRAYGSLATPGPGAPEPDR